MTTKADRAAKAAMRRLVKAQATASRHEAAAGVARREAWDAMGAYLEARGWQRVRVYRHARIMSDTLWKNRRSGLHSHTREAFTRQMNAEELARKRSQPKA